MKSDLDAMGRRIEKGKEDGQRMAKATEQRLIEMVKLICSNARRRRVRMHVDEREDAWLGLEDAAAKVRTLVLPQVEIVPGIQVVNIEDDWLTEIADLIEKRLSRIYRPPSPSRRGRPSTGRADAHAFLRSRGITSERDRRRLITKALRRRR